MMARVNLALFSLARKVTWEIISTMRTAIICDFFSRPIRCRTKGNNCFCLIIFYFKCCKYEAAMMGMKGRWSRWRLKHNYSSRSELFLPTYSCEQKRKLLIFHKNCLISNLVHGIMVQIKKWQKNRLFSALLTPEQIMKLFYNTPKKRTGSTFLW